MSNLFPENFDSKRSHSQPDWADRFGDNVKELRKKQGITQVQLAELAEVTQANISRYEGGVVPSAFIMIKLALALGTTVEDLAGDPMKSFRVPILGYIAAREDEHCAIYPIDDYTPGDEGFGFVDVPFRLEPGFVGLEIRGTSQNPVYRDRDIVIYKRDGDFMAEQCLGKMCIVKLTDGNLMLKEIHRSGMTPGTFDLRSFNAPLLEAQRVEWAAPITIHLPR